ncbi:CBS domain-containing protein [Lysobacter maris]|uniref:CBS domain-containing protein n=1 Tax=Marilutibacter maris TaxID=1605891 RepID=A0A508AVW3_9GAMM|nr:CBS domain-containing protein [Lysobacter maris]KAB8193909.1 CBS domain-containing protein [Lysobacter maris]
MSVEKRLSDIAEELASGGEIPPITVREFLSWFSALRRGSWIVGRIREMLAAAGLRTQPDFESLYIDATFSFVLEDGDADSRALRVGDASAVETSVADEVVIRDAPPYADPTYRLSKLAAANRRPHSVPPAATLREAVTVMVANDYSQLPVMTSERDVKGMVSWNSIGSRLALGKRVDLVRDAMDSHQEIPAEASLFQAIPIIVQHQYVLVRGTDRTVVGIVTASDLSLQFQQLTEPFLLLGEIENHVRRILDQKFATEELRLVKDDGDSGRFIERISDLTFGEYLRLIENPIRWEKLKLPVDRVVFCQQLERVRSIRNDVMHFDPQKHKNRGQSRLSQ